eukprot:scaffold382892_cov73-Cyclotella_meneghiniana.AAC.1
MKYTLFKCKDPDSFSPKSDDWDMDIIYRYPYPPTMKTVALLLVGVSATSATVLESFFGISRNTAEMCLTETTDLFVDTEMTPAFEAVNDEIDGKADCWMPGNSIAYCNNLLDCVSDSCVDYEVTKKVSETLESTALELEAKLNAKCSSTTNNYTVDGQSLSVEGEGESPSAEGEGESSSAEGEETSTVEDTAMDIKDGSSASQCRTLMTATAAIGVLVPLAV